MFETRFLKLSQGADGPSGGQQDGGVAAACSSSASDGSEQDSQTDMVTLASLQQQVGSALLWPGRLVFSLLSLRASSGLLS